MIGFWIGLVVLLTLVALFFHRPILSRMGIEYALERKGQTALVTAGLMIATTVIAASGIVADSSSESFVESVLGRLYVTDATVTSWDSDLAPTSELEAIAADPHIAPHLDQYAIGARVELAFESQVTGLGDREVVIYGIDPGTHARLARYEAVEGTAPGTLAAWPSDGVLLNERAAKAFGVAVGDRVTVFTGGQEFMAPNVTRYDGRLVAAAAAPAITGTQYVHSPQDVYDFVHDVGWSGRDPRLTLTLESSSTAEFVLQAYGREQVYEAGPARAPLNVTVPLSDLDVSTRFQVHSPLAQDVVFHVNVSELVPRVLPPEEFGYDTVGVLAQDGSEPIRNAPAVFMPLPRLQAILEAQGHANTLLLDYEEGARLKELIRSLEQVTDEHMSGFSFFASSDRAELDELKREIDVVTRATFLGLGSFSIIAGFMLIGVMMALLVEERKRLLATARALGAQRGDLTIASVQEGSVYALLSAFAGLLGATALAGLVMGTAETIFQEEGARAVLVVKIGTILSAAGFGFSITLGVIAFAAYRTTRMHIAAALKESDQPVSHRFGLAVVGSLLMLLVGIVLIIAAVLTGSSANYVLGPSLTALALGMLLARGKMRNPVLSTVGLALSIYLMLTFRFITIDDEVDAITMPVRGILLAFTLAIVAAYSSWLHRGVVAATSRIRGVAPLVDSALSHLRQRPGRSALTIAMLATVLVILTALGTMFATFQPNSIGDAGGYDVIADSPFDIGDPKAYYDANPPSSGLDPFPMMGDYAATPLVARGVWSFDVEGDEDAWGIWAAFAPRVTDSMIGLTAEFQQEARLKASSLSSRYTDLDAALSDIRATGGKALAADILKVDRYDGENDRELPDRPLRVGDVLILERGEEVLRLEVVGILKDHGAASLYMSREDLQVVADHFGHDELGTRIWADKARGVSNTELAGALESGFRRVGMEAYDVDNLEAEDAEVGRAFQFIISLFIGLGIIIGIVSLGLIMGRNVLIRKAEIGTMRAVGAQPWQVLVTFSFEALYLTLFAIGIGLGIGLLLAWAMVRIDEFTPDFTVDWGGLLTLYGLTLLAALATAFVPAWRASRIPPAKAVRYVE